MTYVYTWHTMGWRPTLGMARHGCSHATWHLSTLQDASLDRTSWPDAMTVHGDGSVAIFTQALAQAPAAKALLCTLFLVQDMAASDKMTLGSALVWNADSIEREFTMTIPDAMSLFRREDTWLTLDEGTRQMVNKLEHHPTDCTTMEVHVMKTLLAMVKRTDAKDEVNKKIKEELEGQKVVTLRERELKDLTKKDLENSHKERENAMAELRRVNMEAFEARKKHDQDAERRQTLEQKGSITKPSDIDMDVFSQPMTYEETLRLARDKSVKPGETRTWTWELLLHENQNPGRSLR